MKRHESCYHVDYSLSCAEYDDLRRLARGCCKICKTQTDALSIDHDHALGRWAVRGLLCQKCNQHMKLAEAGRRETTAAMSRYLVHAWHKRQASSATKAARVRPRTECAVCGRLTSVLANGKLHRHWSRVPGQHDAICPGAELPPRPKEQP